MLHLICDFSFLLFSCVQLWEPQECVPSTVCLNWAQSVRPQTDSQYFLPD